MKKRILSVLIGCSLLVGTVFTNAVSIEFEEIAETDSLNFEVDSNILSEDIEFSKEEITETKFLLYNFPKAINIEEGTLEYVKTIVGNSYTSFTKKDKNNHYWSQNYGYENIISNILKDAYANPEKYKPIITIDDYKNWGSINEEQVPLFMNAYLPKSSIIKFQIYGSSCSHIGSYAVVKLSNASKTEIPYNSSNQTNNIGILEIKKGNGAFYADMNTYYYRINETGYYTASAIGVAYGCSVSAGHGISIDSEYEIYHYKYNISYNLNGGNLIEKNPLNYYEDSEDIILKNPSKTGYRFLGWTGTDLNTYCTNAIIPSGSYGNRNYTANWEANQYTVIYIDKDINGNEIGRITKLVDYDALVKGSDIGDDKTDNAYYPQYRYVSNTSAKVTTDGAIVYRVFEFCETEAKANLQWNDNNNADGFRPDKYKLKLKQNGKTIEEVELPSDETNYIFPNLPKYDSNGNAYKYTFDVDASNRYQIVFDEDSNLIVEDYLPANFSVTIPKIIVLDGNKGNADYTVSVNGTFYYNDTLTVIPESSLILTDRSKISSMQADISQQKTVFMKEDDVASGTTANGSIQVDKTNFAGSWKGNFNFDIKFKMQN